jgi:phospholipid transport system substrate-binding protein
MTHRPLCAIIIVFVALLGRGAAVAGEPTERIRSVIDELYRLASAPAKTAAERRDRDVAAGKIMERAFDWDAMARQTLKPHWEQRTPVEREEFTRLFSELFRHAYLARLSLVDATAFKYTGETMAAGQANVATTVMTRRGSQIGVVYALGRDAESGWRVHDVKVEGISLLDNYRTQFSSIITRSSYDALVERLRTRAREHG